MSAIAKLVAAVLKELRVIARDRPALAVLFVMPLGFVVVMSLALQDVMATPEAAPRLRFALAVLDADGGEVGRDVVRELARSPFLALEIHAATAEPEAEAVRLRERVRTGEIRAALVIPRGLTRRLDGVLARGDPQALFAVPSEHKLALELLFDPALRADHRLLISTALARALQGVEIRRATERFALVGAPHAPEAQAHADGLMRLAESVPADGGRPRAAPTSSQQNVPAYSLLAIFMLVVPLSQTFIKERAQGCLARLRSMPVPAWVVIGGKFLPYFAINMLQMALCLAVGRYLLPLLGGDALQLGEALPGIALLSVAASVAAIGFALAVAMFADSAEQATAFGATAVLLLAALGGIMVPRMLMPPLLQQLASLSPLGWAQEGFLDLLVRGADVADVAGRAGLLAGFGAVCLAAAAWRFGRLDGAR